MILVSTPGTWEAVDYPLDHAVWHGWTPTDLAFPILVFAMGAAVSPALSRRRDTPGTVRRRVVTRVVVLFVLGLVFNVVQSNPPISWPTFPIFGVLQRIAIVYGVVAMLGTSDLVADPDGDRNCKPPRLLGGDDAGADTGCRRAGYRRPTATWRHSSIGLFSGGTSRTARWESEGLLSTGAGGGNGPVWHPLGEMAAPIAPELSPNGIWLSGLAATVAGLAWGRLFPD